MQLIQVWSMDKFFLKPRVRREDLKYGYTGLIDVLARTINSDFVLLMMQS